jgi:hypothetical protein
MQYNPRVLNKARAEMSGSAIRFSRRPTPTTVGCNTERTNGGWAQSASHTGKREGLNTTEFLTHTHAPARTKMPQDTQK